MVQKSPNLSKNPLKQQTNTQKPIPPTSLCPSALPMVSAPFSNFTLPRKKTKI
ncbi:hypothetical protein BD777DRAFT_131738 [Yarrowia lipolytica]|nr:hypothetical protein BD777DRAFT_131738 [Yarrowia lipolytica]